MSTGRDQEPDQPGSEAAAAWDLMISDAIAEAEHRLADEKASASKRAVQLAREQGYVRLALAIDRPKPRSRRPGGGQLSLFPTDPTLFDDSPSGHSS